jgi:hypothetical protein
VIRPTPARRNTTAARPRNVPEGLRRSGASVRESTDASPDPVDLLGQRILALPGVRKGKSRFGPHAAFFLATVEIAHWHSSPELDLRLTRGLIRELRDPLAHDPMVTFRASPSDWLTIKVATAGDVEFASGLVERAWQAAQ